MPHLKPLAGKYLTPAMYAGLNGSQRQQLRRNIAAVGVSALAPLAGGDLAGNASQPDAFGVFTDADGRVVVDDFTNPISNIPHIVRAFAAANEGYWIEDVFNSPGWTVEGGAVRYTVTRPEDKFLPAGQLMPRAPGAEAPRISGTRRRPVVAYPESVSGSIEVTDEARQRNDIFDVTNTFQQAANTFTETFQALGETALSGLVTASTRFISAGAGTYADWAAAQPIYNFSSTAPRPSQELARVRRTFQEEKNGVMPDTIVWSPEDAENFDRVYEDRGEAVLARYGITKTFTSVRRTAGNRLYLRSGQVGTMAWEKAMGDPEYTREGRRYTDVFTMEGRVVFVANGADAILEARKI